MARPIEDIAVGTVLRITVGVSLYCACAIVFPSYSDAARHRAIVPSHCDAAPCPATNAPLDTRSGEDVREGLCTGDKAPYALNNVVAGEHIWIKTFFLCLLTFVEKRRWCCVVLRV